MNIFFRICVPMHISYGMDSNRLLDKESRYVRTPRLTMYLLHKLYLNRDKTGILHARVSGCLSDLISICGYDLFIFRNVICMCACVCPCLYVCVGVCVCGCYIFIIITHELQSCYMV